MVEYQEYKVIRGGGPVKTMDGLVWPDEVSTRDLHVLAERQTWRQVAQAIQQMAFNHVELRECAAILVENAEVLADLMASANERGWSGRWASPNAEMIFPVTRPTRAELDVWRGQGADWADRIKVRPPVDHGDSRGADGVGEGE